MRFKKILIITIILILFFIPITSFANSDNLNILSSSVILIDANSGKIIYEKNAYKKMYPASTTKVMTAILAIENCDLNDIATVSQIAVSSELVPETYVRADLKEGETFTIEQLLNVLLIPSANDAANVLAEHISGSIDDFCKLMNEKAIEIGCKNTHFVNPNGIHNNNHYSTAYDLSLIAKYAMENETFREFVCKKSCSLPATDKYPEDDRIFTTTNELLLNEENSNYNYYYEYTTGIKTGYTDSAQNCIIASAKKDNNEFICVVLGGKHYTSGKSERAIDCINLFNYAIENYKDKEFLSKASVLKQIEIDVQNNSSQDSEKKILDIVPENDIIIKTTQNPEDITPTITINSDLKAPILKGTVVGTIEYKVDDYTYTTNLIANNDILNSLSVQYLFYTLLIALFIIIIFTTFHHSKKRKKKKDDFGFDFKRFY